jgi:tripartite ATP-independent transporter DctM subunit
MDHTDPIESGGDAAMPQSLSGRIEALEGMLRMIAQRTAILAVAAILMISFSTIYDIILRTFFRSAVYGLNEVLALLVAVAVSTALPYGLSKGSALSVDLLSGMLPDPLKAWLAAVTPIMIAVFFALLGLETWVAAQAMQVTNETTMITLTPRAPFFLIMAGSCIAVALIQAVMALRLTLAAVASTGIVARLTALIVAGIATHAMLVLFGLTDGAIYDAFLPGDSTVLAFVGFIVLWMTILLGLPIGVTMGLVGLIGVANVLGSHSALEIMGSEPAQFVTRDSLSVLPLFLLMGAFAGVAGIGKDLFAICNALFGHVRGGLAHASILACAFFGTLTGSSIATQLTIGKIALAEMQQRNYQTSLAAGAIASGGTLGQLIPPSSALILYAILTEQSVGQLFVGAIIPGILATLFYMLTVAVWLWLRPGDALKGERASFQEIASAARGAWSVILLLGVVLGGIYMGLFTELEAGSVGAAGAFLIALFRGKLTPARFWATMAESTGSLSMIYSLILGVVVLSFFFGISGVPGAFTDFITGLGLSPFGVVLALVACYLVMGTVMDPFAMMVVTIPFFAPLVASLGFDPIWWGIMTVICMEAGMISPPFGLNMFVIATLDNRIPIRTVYRGCWPFFGSTLIKIALLLAFPALVTWLPSTM